ncbi:MAG: hypothetical protein B1H13_09730 [Desulfobacteraceae bacterium 4484_190.3]|nr:MAG: hypothetical protein B1H13_09730 [Desulfobacteraceae bacterium 4484_190.3]
MPTILREGPYRFFFYSGDGNEPVHIHVERENNLAKFWLAPVRLAWSAGYNIHVERENNLAKFWLAPVRLAWSAGYNRVEILKIQKIIEKNHELIVEAWNEYFGN